MAEAMQATKLPRDQIEDLVRSDTLRFEAAEGDIIRAHTKKARNQARKASPAAKAGPPNDQAAASESTLTEAERAARRAINRLHRQEAAIRRKLASGEKIW